MKLSAKKVFKGKLTDIKESAVMVKVKVDIGNVNVVSALISVEAVSEQEVKVGEEIGVLIKIASVMLAK